MYNKVDTNLNFVDREKQVREFWKDNDIFKKSMEQRKQGETYTFYDGPPSMPTAFTREPYAPTRLSWIPP